MEKSIRAYFEDLESLVRPLRKAISLGWWGKETTGETVFQEIVQTLGEHLESINADPERFGQVKSWHERREEIGDPLLRRIVEESYLGAVGNQKTPGEISESLKLSIKISSTFVSHRSEVGGKKMSDNDLLEILKESNDNDERQEAWEASKTIGVVVRDDVIALAHLRNGWAQRLGFRDYYAMRLETQEVEESFLYQLLDDLAAQTKVPFLAHKATDDAKRSQRFGTPINDLMPWHYENPFFQDVPVDPSLTDPWFREKDLEALALETFDSVGLDIRPSLEKSDLYEREGKNQHGFCLSVDDSVQDTRVLCNLRPNTQWADTILHEYGHAIYNLLSVEDLPWFLQGPAHTNSTEAIAMIFGRQVLRPDWLTAFLGVSHEELASSKNALADGQNYKMLAFSRWMQVMCRFERALYADPDQDLNKVWWDLKERYQGLNRPEGRDAPDWASKIHIPNSPVYYHNYMIGEMTASQLEHTIHKESGKGLLKNEEAGIFLRKMFSLGSTLRWDTLVERMTGAPLSANAWATDFAHPPKSSMES
ncbi:M2 family metallopeptidase [bacterium]|nr:M2 family metallopeptidase [bacterium]